MTLSSPFAELGKRRMPVLDLGPAGKRLRQDMGYAHAFDSAPTSPDADDASISSDEYASGWAALASSSACDLKPHVKAGVNRSPTASAADSSRLSPVSPVTPMHRGKDLTKSRTTGQRHRDNQKEKVMGLKLCVSNLVDENLLLFAMMVIHKNNGPGKRYKTSGANNRRGNAPVLDTDLFECQYNSPAPGVVHHRLSDETVRRVGARFCSGFIAMMVLDFLAQQKHMFPSADKHVYASACSEKPAFPAADSSSRNCGARCSTTSEAACDQRMYYMGKTVETAQDVFHGEVASMYGMSDSDRYSYVNSRFGSLAKLWCAIREYDEKYGLPCWDDDEQERQTDSWSVPVPPSPRRTASASFGSPGTRRRGEGAKKCSRCNTLKSHGSGHPRSHCDDGMSVSCPTPYPASEEDGSAGSFSSSAQ